MSGEMENSSNQLLLEPGTLWEKSVRQTELARCSGALQSIDTEYRFIEQNGISFVVRTLSNLARKEKEQKQQQQQEAKTGKRIDPFLPYEEDLFVGDISSTHICLLNKFNVVDNHLLIVTRAFEEQTELLNIDDFTALWACMQEIDGLAFFNGGKIAGASQRHKHLQLVPLALTPNSNGLPIESAIAPLPADITVNKISSFPFRHAIALSDFMNVDSPLAGARMMLDCYQTLLQAVGFNIDDKINQQPGAYNFLATKNWMLLVPRSQESFQSISVNSLGFAGSLFVRDRAAWELLKELTPIKILRNVAFPH